MNKNRKTIQNGRKTNTKTPAATLKDRFNSLKNKSKKLTSKLFIFLLFLYFIYLNLCL